MKKSELKSSIKEEIVEILSEEGTITTGDAGEAEKLAKKGIDVNLTEEPKGVAKDEMTRQKTKDRLVNRKNLADYKRSETEFKDIDDKEPTAKQLKGDSVSILATKLQQTSQELKSTVNKWKSSEGDEKAKLRDKLLKLTKIKKEIEASL